MNVLVKAFGDNWPDMCCKQSLIKLRFEAMRSSSFDQLLRSLFISVRLIYEVI